MLSLKIYSYQQDATPKVCLRCLLGIGVLSSGLFLCELFLFQDSNSMMPLPCLAVWSLFLGTALMSKTDIPTETFSVVFDYLFINLHLSVFCHLSGSGSQW